MIALSSNGFSVDQQLDDAVSYLEHNRPEDFAAFLVAVPEWPTRTFGDGHSSHFDTDAMGVDVEWSSWAIDWLETRTPIYWEDGEPWCREDDDDANPFAIGREEIPDAGGYVVFAVMDDRDTLCTRCVANPDNPVHTDGDADGWRVDGWDHSGNVDTEEVRCAHCGRVIVEHFHVWGPVELSRMAGTPHRKCTGCEFISLDLEDETEVDA